MQVIRDMSVIRLQRNLLGILSGALLIGNICLAIAINTQDKIVVISPAIDKEIVVGTNYVSNDYLQLRANQVIDLLFNLRIENFNYNIEQLLRQVDSKLKPEFSKQLSEFAQDIKSKRYFYTFNQESLEIDNVNLNVTFSGYLDTYLNDKRISSNFKTYNLRFANDSGLVKLTSFEEVDNGKV